MEQKRADVIPSIAMGLSLYDIVIRALFAAAPIVFFALLIIPAPYGRHSHKNRGVPARSAWFWMELPAVLVILFMYLFYRKGPFVPALVPTIFLLFWEAHYVYRTFYYPRRIQGGRRFPGVLMAAAALYNCANGYVNGSVLFGPERVYEVCWLSSPKFIIGAFMFVAGFLVHVESDAKLRALRKDEPEVYSIPKGGLFTLISAPNYFGEIIQWTGWAIATWSAAGAAFAVFTVANLLPRAIFHHRWYRATFDSYPKKRKAIIPFLF